MLILGSYTIPARFLAPGINFTNKQTTKTDNHDHANSHRRYSPIHFVDDFECGRPQETGQRGGDEPILRFSQGAHFGAQTNMTYERSRELDEPEQRRNTCSWVTLGHAGSQSLFTENPRVGSSILPLPPK